MSRAKKKPKSERVTLSNTVDWAIINKLTNTPVGIFNPQGNNGHLRQVAIRAALDNKIPFIKLKLIPVELLSEEEQEILRLANVPTLELPAPKTKAAPRV